MKINAKYVALTSSYAAKLGTLPLFMSGINIRPFPAGGVTIAATNGHMLAVAIDPDGEVEKEVTVSLTKSGVKECSGKGNRQLRLTGNRVCVGVEDEGGNYTNLRAFGEVMDVKYPNINRFIASIMSNTRNVTACLNPDALAIVCKSYDKM